MVSFEIKNKVALITGGGSGLGFQYALGLLEKGARGVALADYDDRLRGKALKEIENKYGENRAIFIKTDVTNYEQFEDAFKKTVETFKYIDILINNAGVMNDAEWQKGNAININGTVHGILIGLETYLPRYKSGPEGLIVNISSVAGITNFPVMPLYAATKFAVHGMTISFGAAAHYERTKVRVVGVCPGATTTPMYTTVAENTLGPGYKKLMDSEVNTLPVQTAEEVAPWVLQVIEKAPSGTMWVIEGGEPPYQFKLPNRLEITKVNLQ